MLTTMVVLGNLGRMERRLLFIEVDALAINNPQLAEFLNESERHADNDLALANAIKHSSAAVVLGYFFHMSAADLNYRIEPQEIERQLKRIGVIKILPFATH